MGLAKFGILRHHGIKGQKWGVRRYQNKDGTLTAEGKKRYAEDDFRRYMRRINDRYKAAVKTVPDVNKIVSTLSAEQRQWLGGRTKGDFIPDEAVISDSYDTTKRFIAKKNGIPVSMLTIKEGSPGFGKVVIATDNSYSRQGYATKNIQRAKKWLASDRNWPKVNSISTLLWTADKDNIASQNLAKKNGFVEYDADDWHYQALRINPEQTKMYRYELTK